MISSRARLQQLFSFLFEKKLFFDFVSSCYLNSLLVVLLEKTPPLISCQSRSERYLNGDQPLFTAKGKEGFFLGGGGGGGGGGGNYVVSRGKGKDQSSQTEYKRITTGN